MSISNCIARTWALFTISLWTPCLYTVNTLLALTLQKGFSLEVYYSRLNFRSFFAPFQNEGQFVWSDTSALDFTFWQQGEPNDLSDQDCVAMGTDGYWIDESCNTAAGYVCKTSYGKPTQSLQTNAKLPEEKAFQIFSIPAARWGSSVLPIGDIPIIRAVVASLHENRAQLPYWQFFASSVVYRY